MILGTIAEATRARVEKAKQQLSIEELKAKIYNGAFVRSFSNRDAFAFERALRRVPCDSRTINTDKTDKADKADKASGMAFICEVKKASPSKGIIAEDFPYLEIAKEYESAGADAISVLTEPEFFKGDNRYLAEISRAVSIPVLRKDFTIDEYQIYEAKVIGADAVLLICSLTDTEALKKYIAVCDELGLSALVEAHTEDEVYLAIKAGARVIGVNNRNLKTFEVDLNNSLRLRKLVPEEIIFVAESGIKTPSDTAVLREAGVNAALIGETLMRSPEKKEIIRRLRG